MIYSGATAPKFLPNMATLWLMRAKPYPELHKGAQDRKPDLGLLVGRRGTIG